MKSERLRDFGHTRPAIQSQIWTSSRVVHARNIGDDRSVVRRGDDMMEKGFGQFCPVALASEVLTQRWTLLVIRELLAGSTHFNDIRRGVPRISATLLKERLETLEHAEIVERRKSSDSRTYEYVLTRAGQELKSVLTGVGEWGQRWARDIRPEDLDPGWLVWNVHRRLNKAQLPAGRTVIQMEFTDRVKDGRYFWLVCDSVNVEVCLKHPGYTVDLHVRTTVRVFAEAWRGIRSVRQEIRAGSIGLDGKAALRRAFPNWLLLSTYASIARAR
jgi:DNA-binding HxlR family transcriptional regulator